MHTRTFGVVLALAALGAVAQPRTPDPLDPSADVPPARHRSTLAGFRAGEAPRGDWKAANDTVGRIGGWRAYAREAAAPASAAAASAPHPGHPR